MRNGYVLKLLENIERLVNDGRDVGPFIDAAKSQVEHNHDANQQEWDELNAAVDTLDKPGNSESSLETRTPTDVKPGGSRQFISNAEPGSPSNPIGYPGTDQDQERPGAGDDPHRVPGVRIDEDKK